MRSVYNPSLAGQSRLGSRGSRVSSDLEEGVCVCTGACISLGTQRTVGAFDCPCQAAARICDCFPLALQQLLLMHLVPENVVQQLAITTHDNVNLQFQLAVE